MLCIVQALNGQEIPDLPDAEDLIESIAETQGNVDPDIQFQSMDHEFSGIPLNKATRQDLENLGLLSPQQVQSLISYREQLGPLLRLQELQAVPDFDMETIGKLLPFVYLDNNRFIGFIGKPVKIGPSRLFIRYDRFFQRKKGFVADMESKKTPFEGNPGGLLLRFINRRTKGWNFGCTLEKDPGESFFGHSNPYGFDFNSFHVFYTNPESHIQTVGIGDYIISFGQGLLINAGYSAGKTLLLTHLKKPGLMARPYSGRDENRFFRGAVLSGSFRPVRVTVFGSIKKRDANITGNNQSDTPLDRSFSSFQTSGLHRTTSEIYDEKVILHKTTGIRVDLEVGNFTLGFNYVLDHFSNPFNRRYSVHSQFLFSGQTAFGASVDYSFRVKNLHFFGETSISKNLARAHIHGLLCGLSKYLNVGLLWRYLPGNYWTVWADPLRESGEVANENGLLFGLQLRINSLWGLSAFSDFWRHPWLKSNISSPSTGKEHFFRLMYEQKRKLQAYIQYRSEEKMKDARESSEKLTTVIFQRRKSVRIQMNYQVRRNLELRNRIEVNRIQAGPDPPGIGFLVYQDIIFKAMKLPLQISARLAHFDTRDYDSRIYAYERNIIHGSTVPAYYLEGIRYYVNVRYSPFDFLTAEIRWEQTKRTKMEGFGSGADEIPGKKKSLVRMQAVFRF